MRAFLAIVGDTWRQSRSQWVFLILLALLLLGAAGAGLIPRRTAADDGEARMGLVFSDGPLDEDFAQPWTIFYAETLRLREGDLAASADESGFQATRYFSRAMDAAKAKPLIERQVEVWAYGFIRFFFFTCSIMLFIAAAAGFFPDLLTSGAVDVVVSKPVSRWTIYLGKYVGGLVLYSGAVVLSTLVFYLLLGMRTGVWIEGILRAMPMNVFSAAVVYALLAVFGVAFRSTTLCVVLGYFYYVVIDEVLAVVVRMSAAGMLENWPILEKVIDGARYVLPNFSLLKEVAVSSVLAPPPLHTTPFLTALAWLFGLLGLGLVVFQTKDL